MDHLDLFSQFNLLLRKRNAATCEKKLSRTYDLLSRTYDLLCRTYEIIFLHVAALRFRSFCCTDVK